VDGTGSVAPEATSSRPDPQPTIPSTVPAPSSSSSAPAPIACPNVTYPAGRIAFACITAGLTIGPDELWPLALSRATEPGWAVAEGAGKIADLGDKTLAQIATARRDTMVATEYGEDPSSKTVSGKTQTVAGVPAYVLETEITINPTYRAENDLQVKVERQWIVAINAGNGTVATWFVTIPDDLRELWARVPAVITSIGLI
jgi:hypothetical protein